MSRMEGLKSISFFILKVMDLLGSDHFLFYSLLNAAYFVLEDAVTVHFEALILGA